MDECVKFRHFCKEDENNARRNQKNLRRMTLTDKEKLEAIKKILIELEEASGIVPGTKQITGWKSLFASTRWNKLSNNEQLKRIGKYIDGTVLEHNEKINKILES
mgnify:FL=1